MALLRNRRYGSMFASINTRFLAGPRTDAVTHRRHLLLLASALLLACHSSATGTESEGVPQIEVPQFNLHEFYRLIAINGDTARVFPHDSLITCPRAATTYQWSTLAFTSNAGQFVTLGAAWHPLCPTGSPYTGIAQSVASYTQNSSALTLTFTFSSTPITARISAGGDTIRLDNMRDLSGEPTWTNTAQFTYVACGTGPCQ